MQTQHNSTAATANGPAQRPGEYSHYYVNLLTLFGRQRPVAQIAALARQAVDNRDAEIARFAGHLEDLYQDFSAQARHTGQRAVVQPQPQLCGWEQLNLDALRQLHGGLLIALFHYGPHRQVFSDLGVRGMPYVAPVAKQAYFDCTRMTSIAPLPFENAMGLIEVEDPRVGRTLLQSLRKGRIGVIYVDGNMGPDGHRVEEGALEVDFLGRRIRVKEGIARLSHSMGIPVLPVSVRAASDTPGTVGQLVCGPLLKPCAKADAQAMELSRQCMMQSIYDCLAQEVQRDASVWEFAFCLHRWVVNGESDESTVRPTDEIEVAGSSRVSLPNQEIALFERDDEQYWVHVGRQKAFKLPRWAHGLYAFLNIGPRSRAETCAWLESRNAAVQDAHDLMNGLQQRGLLAVH